MTRRDEGGGQDERLEANTLEPGSDRPTDKRARILEAAREILAAKRYDDVPVSEIVERAGVAKGTFYLYFPSKADLVATIASAMREEMRDAITKVTNSERPIAEVLETVMWTVYRTAQEHRDLMSIFELEMLLRGPGPRLEEHDERIRGLVGMLERARARGEVTPDLDPGITAELMSGVMLPLARAIMTGQSSAPVERYIAETVAFLTRALGATSPR